MQLVMNIALYLRADALTYLKPADLMDGAKLCAALHTMQVNKLDVAAAEEQIRRYSPSAIVLTVVPIVTDINLTVESLAAAGAAAFQSEAAAIRAKAYAEAMVLEEKANRLLAIENSPSLDNVVDPT